MRGLIAAIALATVSCVAAIAAFGPGSAAEPAPVEVSESDRN